MAGAVQHEHERHVFLERQLADAVALRRRAGPDRTAEHREVLGRGEHGPPVDLAEAGDEGIGRDLGPTCERSDFAEGPGVEEQIEARAGIELAAAGHQAFDALRPAHSARDRAAAFEFFEYRLPVVAHGSPGSGSVGRQSRRANRPAPMLRAP